MRFMVLNARLTLRNLGVVPAKQIGYPRRMDRKQLARIRILLGIVIIGLVLSGLTAIPLRAELRVLGKVLSVDGDGELSSLQQWIRTVRDGLIDVKERYPFMAYGTDWLAFAHFVIAVAFIGPWRDPVRNVWVIEFGLIACVLVIPYALVMGALREIPWGWRLIDCSFGVFGFLPLWLCRREITRHTVT